MINCISPSDFYLYGASRIRILIRNYNPGNLALQGLKDVGDWLTSDLFRSDCTNISRCQPLGSRAIRLDNCLVQLIFCFFQIDLCIHPFFNQYVLRRIPDKADDQGTRLKS